MSEKPVPVEVLRTAPVDVVGQHLLEHFGRRDQGVDLGGFAHSLISHYRGEERAGELVERVLDGWAWLEGQALLAPENAANPQRRRMSKEGRARLHADA